MLTTLPSPTCPSGTARSSPPLSGCGRVRRAAQIGLFPGVCWHAVPRKFHARRFNHRLICMAAWKRPGAGGTLGALADCERAGASFGPCRILHRLPHHAPRPASRFILVAGVTLSQACTRTGERVDLAGSHRATTRSVASRSWCVLGSVRHPVCGTCCSTTHHTTTLNRTVSSTYHLQQVTCNDQPPAGSDSTRQPRATYQVYAAYGNTSGVMIPVTRHCKYADAFASYDDGHGGINCTACAKFPHTIHT